MNDVPMLSKAIYRGAKLRPQIYDGSFWGCVNDDCEGEEWIYGTCALGAAKEALVDEHEQTGIHHIPDIIFSYPLEWSRDLIKPGYTCPACGVSDNLESVISNHLNDTHRWRRERIAAWVRTQGY